MSDTPETDAETHDLSDYGPPVPCSWGDWVAADHARKLERERDEARAMSKDMARQFWQAEIKAERYCQERDKAREEAHRFRALHYSHLGINGSASWFPWEDKLGRE